MIQLLKEAAELYAIGSISKEDVVWLVKRDLDINVSFESLPQEFHDYVKAYSEEYESYLHHQRVLELKKEMTKINTKAEEILNLIHDLDLEVGDGVLTAQEAAELLTYGNIVE